MRRLFRSGRPILCVLALALIVTAVPLPAFAGGPATPAPRPGLRASISPIVHGVVSATPAPQQGQTKAPVDRTPLESKSFFKSSVGVAVIAIVAAGTGYALYSWKHDRVQPQGR